MKLRPVLLVILILSAFYYATTHIGSTSASAPWLHHAVPAPADLKTSTSTAAAGPLGNFELTQASAAPAYDTE